MKSEEITVIEAKSGWQPIDWRELVRYRDLLYHMVLRDVMVLYKQTVMGFSWAIIRPVFSTLVFTIIFGKVVKMASDGIDYSVFCFAGQVTWFYFATAMNRSTESLVTGKDMLTKIYFPRLMLPLTPIAAGLVDFCISFLVLFIYVIARGYYPGPSIVYLPVVVAVMMMTALGVGLWLSALNIQYRDIKHANQFMLQILMYAAPVVWPASKVFHHFANHPVLVRVIYGLYPMAGVTEGFRAALLGRTPMPWLLLGTGAASAALILVTGLFYFRRMERIFADVA